MIDNISESIPCIAGFIILAGLFVGFGRFMMNGMQKTINRNTEVIVALKTLIEERVK